MATNPNSAALDAINSAGVNPTQAATRAELAPLAGAGVDLARRTMLMISAAAALLMVLLLLAEWSERAAMDDVTKNEMALIEKMQGSGVDPRLAGVVSSFRDAAQQASAQLSGVAAADAAALIDAASKNPLTSESQRADLSKCLPLPAPDAPARGATLGKCADTLNQLFGSSQVPNAQIASIQTLQKSMQDERTSHRAFWIQIAQMILINLLLPILTALLGYIFGSQRES